MIHDLNFDSTTLATIKFLKLTFSHTNFRGINFYYNSYIDLMRTIALIYINSNNTSDD